MRALVCDRKQLTGVSTWNISCAHVQEHLWLIKLINLCGWYLAWPSKGSMSNFILCYLITTFNFVLQFGQQCFLKSHWNIPWSGLISTLHIYESIFFKLLCCVVHKRQQNLKKLAETSVRTKGKFLLLTVDSAFPAAYVGAPLCLPSFFTNLL